MIRAYEAYRAIARHYDATGYGISFRELAAYLGCGLDSVYRAVSELEGCGRIMPRKHYANRALVPRGRYVTINGERFIGEAV